jgi:hypothetical protein
MNHLGNLLFWIVLVCNPLITGVPGGLLSFFHISMQNSGDILHDLLEELRKLPGLAARVDYALLVALAFKDDDTKSKRLSFSTVDPLSSLE